MIDDEFILDEVKGEVGRKPIMSVLNRAKLSKYELDELLNSDWRSEKGNAGEE